MPLKDIPIRSSLLRRTPVIKKKLNSCNANILEYCLVKMPIYSTEWRELKSFDSRTCISAILMTETDLIIKSITLLFRAVSVIAKNLWVHQFCTNVVSRTLGCWMTPHQTLTISTLFAWQEVSLFIIWDIEILHIFPQLKPTSIRNLVTRFSNFAQRLFTSILRCH